MEEMAVERVGVLAEIGELLYVSDRDKRFAENVCPDSDSWWNEGRPCDFKSLKEIVDRKLEQVMPSSVRYQFTKCSPQLLVADVYSEAADFSLILEDLYNYCSRQIDYAPSTTATATATTATTTVAPVSPPEATTSTPVSKPAILLRVPDPSRPERLPEVPSGPLEGLGSNENISTIVSALNAALCFVEHMSSVEREIMEKEGWNFDTTVALLDLTQRMRRIPFGGETSTRYDVQPSTKSSKGKERETTPAPKESVLSWLGDSSVEGEFRIVFPTPFSQYFSGDPMLRMDPILPTQTFDEWLNSQFPKLFDNEKDHDCLFRVFFVEILKRQLQRGATGHLAGE